VRRAIAAQLPRNCLAILARSPITIAVAHSATVTNLLRGWSYAELARQKTSAGPLGLPVGDAGTPPVTSVVASPQKLGGAFGHSSLAGSASMPALRSLRGRDERWQRWG
jgi:hypothetical protein